MDRSAVNTARKVSKQDKDDTAQCTPARARGRARALRIFSGLPAREQRLALRILTALAHERRL